MEPPRSGPAHDALAHAALLDDRIGYVVLLALRDAAGQVADFLHELVNPLAEASAGQPLLGRRQLEVFDPEDGALFEAYRDLVGSGASLRTELRVHTPVGPSTDGMRFEVYARAVGQDRVVCQYQDVTQERVANEALRRDALQDELTALPNRRAFLELLDHALKRLDRQPGLVGVLYCDLNGFKQVNDTLGHAAGDRLLIQVAHQMTRSLRPQDVVARYGGDEFLVLCEDLAQVHELLQVARRLQEGLNEPSTTASIDDRWGTVGMSIGAAATDIPVSAELLLSRADSALYLAKSSPGDGIFVSPGPPGQQTSTASE